MNVETLISPVSRLQDNHHRDNHKPMVKSKKKGNKKSKRSRMRQWYSGLTEAIEVSKSWCLKTGRARIIAEIKGKAWIIPIDKMHGLQEFYLIDPLLNIKRFKSDVVHKAA